jgi:TolB-like protein/DNA-binding winged helix-turn-helix (wHTH) protein/tetratricopeptide (TPR) repeat protein
MSAPERHAGPSAAIYRIGDVVLDAGRATVVRDGHEIALPKLSFDLLAVLAEAAPRVLTLDDLMERVWRGVIVSPETISQRVKLLRDALGDNAAQPRYVASVRGRGYRLVASVERLDVATPPPQPAGDTRPPESAPRQVSESAAAAAAGGRAVLDRQRRSWLLAGIAATVLIGIGVWLFALREPKESATPDRKAVVTAPRAVAVMPFVDLSGTQSGSTLALGIAETLRHQLAGLKEIDVIGYSSSTALSDADLDSSELGRRLHARYLLSGSVQTSAAQLRVVAQLTDVTSGLQLWSIRFDRAPEGVFAMQDEIAVAVAKALTLSVDADARGRLTHQGTTDFDAYLAYLQGRALLTSGSVQDARLAGEQFERAIASDPGFAGAYVALAEAQVFVGEYDFEVERAAGFTQVVQRAEALVEKALTIDPALGAAYLERGYLRAFSNRASAEKDLRRGLELSPNDARGYAKLASVVFADRRRSAEALAVLDRARRLEPLEPEYDVTRAVYLLYGKGDPEAAEDSLVHVLEREPLYPPALSRLAEVHYCCDGRMADAVQLGQQALALDPLAEWTRRVVIRSAVSMGLPQIARAAQSGTPETIELQGIPLLLRSGQARMAAEVGYRAIAADALFPIDEPVVVSSIRLAVRETHDYSRAIEALRRNAGIRVDGKGDLHLSDQAGMKVSAVGLADVLMLAGRRDEARRLLERLLADMRYEAVELGRTDRWFGWTKPLALLLLDRRDEALAELERADLRGQRVCEAWFYFNFDPVFAPLHAEPRFRVIRAELEQLAQRERERYLAMNGRPAD